jgi:hypothetical protein
MNTLGGFGEPMESFLGKCEDMATREIENLVGSGTCAWKGRPLAPFSLFQWTFNTRIAKWKNIKWRLKKLETRRHDLSGDRVPGLRSPLLTRIGITLYLPSGFLPCCRTSGAASRHPFPAIARRELHGFTEFRSRPSQLISGNLISSDNSLSCPQSSPELDCCSISLFLDNFHIFLGVVCYSPSSVMQSMLQWHDSRRQQCSESTYQCCSEEEVSNIYSASSVIYICTFISNKEVAEKTGATSVRLDLCWSKHSKSYALIIALQHIALQLSPQLCMS